MRDTILKILFRKSIKARQRRVAYLFLLPCVIYFSILYLVPFIYVFYLSCHIFPFIIRGTPRYVGLQLYNKVFGQELFWESMLNTIFFTSISLPCTVLISLVVALLLLQSVKGHLRGFIKSIYFLPVIASLVAVALIWKWLYQPNIGLFNQILRKIHLPPQKWLSDMKLVIPALAVMNIWARLGLDTIIFIAGLEGIPKIYYEASKIDGANKFNRFRYITLPLLNPQIILVLILETIFTFKIFDIPFVATQGGPANSSRTVVLHIYDQAFKWNKPGEASVAALFLFVVILTIAILQWRTTHRQISY